MSARAVKPSRESVTTIKQDGSRNFLRPADVSGKLTLWRRIVAVLLIVVYAALPWIPINGYPAVFLDTAKLRFHFFGITLVSEDLWFLFFILTGIGFSLFFVAAVFGRLWCGWACPQTVFMEHVYRRIERLIEGSSSKQKELDRRGWDKDKFLRRSSKHLLFIGLSALIAHIFLSYFISVDALFAWLSEGPGAHPKAFGFMVVMTGLLYFNFAWFREQLCLIICPYGRLQSALVDEDTYVIGYDEVRGEPRGKPTNPAHGDCINCHRCVQVCPTGIDIRQGLQMECVGCHNCVDACNEIMDKLDRPRGLIRYDSLNGLAGKPRRILRPRVYVYLALAALGAIAMFTTVQKIKPGNMNVTRMRGSAFFVQDGLIRNQFNVRLINKRNQEAQFDLRVITPDGLSMNTRGFGKSVTLEAMEETTRPLVLTVPIEEWQGDLTLQVIANGEPGDYEVQREIEFLGPDPRLLEDENFNPNAAH